MKYIQPQFVKFNSNDELPTKIQNKYFLYYGTGLIGVNGIPAIYVSLDSIDKLFSFIQKVQNNVTVLLNGSNDFVLNEDYYLSKSLYLSLTIMEDTGSSDDNYFLDDNQMPFMYNDTTSTDSTSTDYEKTILYLPDYITDDINTDYFEPVTMFSELLQYLKNKNKYADYEFIEDELLSFCATFCSVILSLSAYQLTSNIDMINKQVLNYFANYQSDSTILGMTLIFNNKYASQTSTSSNCGCASSASQDSICTTSCVDYYISAMAEYLKSMLGNNEFYENWFYIHEDGISSEVNTELLNKLRIFITEFLSLDINIGTNKHTVNTCNCPTVDLASDSCNRGIINNYLKVLDYVENCEIEENVNKIKVYGEAFAELLPKLQF